jgi:hypothetical protein
MIGGSGGGGSPSDGGGGGGGGGAILIASSTLIRVEGTGRIRIDSIDRTELNFWFQPAAAASIGSFMTLQPNPLPRLGLVRAAGVDIAADSGPLYLELPFGSPAAQEIEVQARDFRAVVPIRVRLVPEAGAAVEYALELDNRTENPVRGSVTVSVPANVRTAVEVWTAPTPAP